MCVGVLFARICALYLYNPNSNHKPNHKPNHNPKHNPKPNSNPNPNPNPNPNLGFYCYCYKPNKKLLTFLKIYCIVDFVEACWKMLSFVVIVEETLHCWIVVFVECWLCWRFNVLTGSSIIFAYSFYMLGYCFIFTFP